VERLGYRLIDGGNRIKPQSARNLTGKYLRPLKHYRQAKTAEEYWNQRVIKHAGYYDTDCWQFPLPASDKNGYKQIHTCRWAKELGVTRAHQLSYVLHKGPIEPGKLVCHTCDNTWCVNPDHLFLGSPNDNVQDMIKKGRYINHWKKNEASVK
jgi:hypothetical protein